MNRVRDSDRLGHFSIVVRPSGRRRARCEASTALLATFAHARASIGRGWCFPAGVVLRNGDRCLVPGDDARSFGIARCVAPGWSPRGGRSGHHGRIVMGAERSSSYVTRSSSDFRGVRRLIRQLERLVGESGRTSKGDKAQEGQDAAPIGNGRLASGLGGGATPRSRGSVQVGLRDVRRQRWMSEGLAGTKANGKGATATVTWCGCYRGFFEGYEVRCEDAMSASHRRSACRSTGSGPGWSETQRTP